MRGTREQITAELLVEAAGVIEEMLDWERQAGAPDLTELEEAAVLRLRQRLGQRMLEAVLADQEVRQPAQASGCSHCGAAMRYKGQKATAIESRLGALKVGRGYYHCARCASGFSPCMTNCKLLRGISARAWPGKRSGWRVSCLMTRPQLSWRR